MAKDQWQIQIHNAICRAILDNIPNRPTQEQSEIVMEICTNAAASICCRVCGITPTGDQLVAMSRAGFEAIASAGESWMNRN